MFLTNEGRQLHLVVDGEGQSPSVSLGAPQESVACPVEALVVCYVWVWGLKELLVKLKVMEIS